jgi:hypothetical protein
MAPIKPTIWDGRKSMVNPPTGRINRLGPVF